MKNSFLLLLFCVLSPAFAGAMAPLPLLKKSAEKKPIDSVILFLKSGECEKLFINSCKGECNALILANNNFLTSKTGVAREALMPIFSRAAFLRVAFLSYFSICRDLHSKKKMNTPWSEIYLRYGQVLEKYSEKASKVVGKLVRIAH
ncbi:MAG: hypothetical protein UV79_C0006G0003 [candidate division TM6 bacterium GW2011_GWF2_43_17]|nr:MAG: hypothetical protein UV79_C0006G0003 [candidate division TM6 bacterium GW2011_GWF2_43_17]HAU30571.1 hypothetical protein [Candidatus Dependentiae bacterium]